MLRSRVDAAASEFWKVEVTTSSSPIPSDLDIAKAAEISPVVEIAERVGLLPEELIAFGTTKAKVHLDALRRVSAELDDDPEDESELPEPLEEPLGESPEAETFFFAPVLKSVSYQPPPFNRKAAAEISFFNPGLSQAGQSTSGLSENF